MAVLASGRRSPSVARRVGRERNIGPANAPIPRLQEMEKPAKENTQKHKLAKNDHAKVGLTSKIKQQNEFNRRFSSRILCVFGKIL